MSKSKKRKPRYEYVREVIRAIVEQGKADKSDVIILHRERLGLSGERVTTAPGYESRATALATLVVLGYVQDAGSSPAVYLISRKRLNQLKKLVAPKMA
jgi:hypothetical protein